MSTTHFVPLRADRMTKCIYAEKEHDITPRQDNKFRGAKILETRSQEPGSCPLRTRNLLIAIPKLQAIPFQPFGTGDAKNSEKLMENMKHFSHAC